MEAALRRTQSRATAASSHTAPRHAACAGWRNWRCACHLRRPSRHTRLRHHGLHGMGARRHEAIGSASRSPPIPYSQNHAASPANVSLFPLRRVEPASASRHECMQKGRHLQGNARTPFGPLTRGHRASFAAASPFSGWRCYRHLGRIRYRRRDRLFRMSGRSGESCLPSRLQPCAPFAEPSMSTHNAPFPFARARQYGGGFVIMAGDLMLRQVGMARCKAAVRLTAASPQREFSTQALLAMSTARLLYSPPASACPTSYSLTPWAHLHSACHRTAPASPQCCA